jgi:hypothetical protein
MYGALVFFSFPNAPLLYVSTRVDLFAKPFVAGGLGSFYNSA